MKKTLIALAVLAVGQTQAQNTIDLNPVTITAGRNPQKASETGRNITVVDGKVFSQLPVNSLDELLKYVPGIDMQSRGPLGSQSDISIRGGTYQQVLVLIDGVKLNDPITGHFSSYIPISPSEIERIEILRGPASALYGSEAVGGVINIITKTFNKFNPNKSTKGNIEVAGGEYGLFRLNSGVQYSSSKINATAGYLNNTAEGQLIRGNNRGYNNNNTLNASIAFALKNNWQLSVRSGYDSRDFAAQNFYTTFVSDTAVEKVTSFWNQLNLKQQKERSSQQLDVVYKKSTDFYLYNPKSIANKNNSNYLFAQYIRSTKLNSNMALSFGAVYDRRAIESNDRGNHETNHGAVFGTLLYTAKKLKVAPSLRIDNDQNYGTAVIPQLNLSYQIKTINFRANAGRAIRSADYTERYNNYNKTLVTGGSIGNPDLGTENSWSYEAGADWFLNKNFKFSVSGFYRDQDNVIDWVKTAYDDMPRKDNLIPSGSYSLAQNVKKVQTSGVEFDAVFQKTTGNNQSIFVNAGFTILDSKTGDDIPSFYILSHAKSMIQGNVIYRIGGFSISANTIYKCRNVQKAASIGASVSRDYLVLNGRMGYTFQKKAEIFVATTNIGDVAYSDLLGGVMPKSWTSAGFNLRF